MKKSRKISIELIIIGITIPIIYYIFYPLMRITKYSNTLIIFFMIFSLTSFFVNRFWKEILYSIIILLVPMLIYSIEISFDYFPQRNTDLNFHFNSYFKNWSLLRKSLIMIPLLFFLLKKTSISILILYFVVLILILPAQIFLLIDFGQAFIFYPIILTGCFYYLYTLAFKVDAMHEINYGIWLYFIVFLAICFGIFIFWAVISFFLFSSLFGGISLLNSLLLTALIPSIITMYQGIKLAALSLRKIFTFIPSLILLIYILYIFHFLGFASETYRLVIALVYFMVYIVLSNFFFDLYFEDDPNLIIEKRFKIISESI